MRAVLFDLDETLVPDYGGFLAAVDECASSLGAPAGMGRTLHERARPLWGQAPDAAVAGMRDMSSWEALWAPFPPGTDGWGETFRAAAWEAALRDHGVEDSALAGRLASGYREHRAAGCRPFPDTVAALEALAAAGIVLAVVTNGQDRHQRDKLVTAGLTGLFAAVVTSEGAGASKPDPHIFRVALQALGCVPADAAMVGDHPLRDVAGAQQSGLRGVWVDRDGGDPRGVVPDARIDDLGGLQALGWW
jgi:putative hydrolase of the HAD superfamily